MQKGFKVLTHRTTPHHCPCSHVQRARSGKLPVSPSEGGPRTPQDTAGRRWRDSSPHWHIQEPDLGQQPVCSTAPAGRQGLVSLDGGQRSLWAAMPGGLGDNETFWKCSPWVPDTTSSMSQQASQLGLVLWCFRQIGAGGPHWGKDVAESLLCPWQHEHTTASCGAEGSL